MDGDPTKPLAIWFKTSKGRATPSAGCPHQRQCGGWLWAFGLGSPHLLMLYGCPQPAGLRAAENRLLFQR